MKLTKLVPVLLLLLVLINCKNNTRKILQKIELPTKIYFDIQFSDDVKINNKLIYELDLTDDSLHESYDYVDLLKMLVETGLEDTTNDINDKYILDKDKIEYYKAYEEYFSDTVYEITKSYIENNDIDTSIEFLTDDLSSDGIVIRGRIKEYYEGEFNFIQNIDTRLVLEVIIEKTDGSEAGIFNRRYKVRPDIEYPLERQRINIIANQACSDIITLFSKRLLDKKKETSGDLSVPD